MPRTREFDPVAALEDAMATFWEKGYTATSVEDLVSATGVNRYGLYDVYESKHGLFIAALEHYHDTVISEALFELERPGAGLDAIHAVFARLVRRAGSRAGRHGCLLCNAAEEVAPFDPEAARVVAAFQGRLADRFERAVRGAMAAGEVPADRNAAELGRFLAGLIQGASFLARSPAAPGQVAGFVRVGLRALE